MSLNRPVRVLRDRRSLKATTGTATSSSFTSSFTPVFGSLLTGSEGGLPRGLGSLFLGLPLLLFLPLPLLLDELLSLDPLPRSLLHPLGLQLFAAPPGRSAPGYILYFNVGVTRVASPESVVPAEGERAGLQSATSSSGTDGSSSTIGIECLRGTDLRRFLFEKEESSRGHAVFRSTFCFTLDYIFQRYRSGEGEVVREVVREVDGEVVREVVREVDGEVIREVVGEVVREIVREVVGDVVREVVREVVGEVVGPCLTLAGFTAVLMAAGDLAFELFFSLALCCLDTLI
ncbi:hypothetical protein EYF80_045785 [Liparis tanakae]|uniref:Uncharacterized protein n=1 Tax=Liparis tanakae TaxID=230148 RepID=A0A4Z2FT18_9TELE|nr:hypothetical protein EYF80_045785 [Liparis tanakae]